MSIWKRSFCHGAAAAGLTVAGAACAQWLPQTIHEWTPSESRGFNVRNVISQADGDVFISASMRTGSPRYATISRFDAIDGVQWGLIGPFVHASKLAPAALLANDRVAIVGEYFDEIFIEVRDRATGALVWDDQISNTELPLNQQFVSNALVQTPNGNLLVRIEDDDEFVLLRYDENGASLPAWRWPCPTLGSGPAYTFGLLATTDGGVVVLGGCGAGSGIVTVRLDATGTELFHDIELGENNGAVVSAAAFVGVDADDSLIVAAGPETLTGVTGAMVWKISANGTRLWTTAIPRRMPFDGADARAFLIAANGDALVAVGDTHDPPRVLRIDHATGTILWAASPPAGDMPTALAEAPNGRIMIVDTSYVPNPQDPPLGERVYAITEFTADGRLCRRKVEVPGAYQRVTTSSNAWVVVGQGALGPENQTSLVVQRFDTDGTCNYLFADGFEPGF